MMFNMKNDGPSLFAYITAFAIVGLLLYVTIWGLYIWILTYMFKLEKQNCKCALGWKHKFIQVYMIMHIAMLPLVLIANLTGIRNTKPVIILFKLMSTFISLGSLVFIPTVYMYIQDLEKNGCSCSKDSARTTLKVLNYFTIGLIIFAIVLFIASLIFEMKETKKRESDKNRLLAIENTPVFAPAKTATDVINSIPSKGSKKIKRKSRK